MMSYTQPNFDPEYDEQGYLRQFTSELFDSLQLNLSQCELLHACGDDLRSEYKPNKNRSEQRNYVCN